MNRREAFRYVVSAVALAAGAGVVEAKEERIGFEYGPADPDMPIRFVGNAYRVVSDDREALMDPGIRIIRNGKWEFIDFEFTQDGMVFTDAISGIVYWTPDGI